MSALNEVLGFAQENAAKDPVKPETLIAIADLQPLVELVLNGLTGLRQFRARGFDLTHLKMRQGQHDLNARGTDRISLLIGDGFLTQILCALIISPTIFHQSQ